MRAFMASPEEKIYEASPDKIRKTGNVVLDKINFEVEKQRNSLKMAQGSNALFDADLLLSSESSGEEDGNIEVGEKKLSPDGKPETKNILNNDQADKVTV